MSMKDSPFWPFGPSHPDAIKRLGEADKAISAMTPEERRAAFDWMKSKYAAEWPYSS